MKQFVNRNNEPVAKAAGVQPEHLPSPPHPQLAGALGPTADDGHIVDAVMVSRQKRDAGRSTGYVVHCLCDRGSVPRWESPIELVLNYPKRPEHIRISKVSVGERWIIGEVAEHDVAFKCFLDGW